MTIRRLPILGLGLLIGIIGPGCQSSPGPMPNVHLDDASRPPHIVLILADDLGAGDLGCLNPDAKTATPHLDTLARDGVVFTDAHSPSAVCSPTRYGILTGRYCWRTTLKSGVLWTDDPLLI